MTKRFSISLWLGVGMLVVASAAAMAQQPARQPGTSADELLSLGLDALRQIDEDHGPLLWNAAPIFLKARLSQAEFVSGIRKSRATLGTVTQRDWSGVVRIRYLDDTRGVPVGLYANVDFATQTASGKTVHEKVSFRLETDGWHFTGYVPREEQ